VLQGSQGNEKRQKYNVYENMGDQLIIGESRGSLVVQLYITKEKVSSVLEASEIQIAPC
jgi:hypothetical protein